MNLFQFLSQWDGFLLFLVCLAMVYGVIEVLKSFFGIFKTPKMQRVLDLEERVGKLEALVKK